MPAAASGRTWTKPLNVIDAATQTNHKKRSVTKHVHSIYRDLVIQIFATAVSRLRARWVTFVPFPRMCCASRTENFSPFGAAGLGTVIAINPSVSAAGLSKESQMTSITAPIRRIICGFGGHELMRSYSPGRLCLRCAWCAYETPGWIIKERRKPVARGARALIARWVGN